MDGQVSILSLVEKEHRQTSSPILVRSCRCRYLHKSSAL